MLESMGLITVRRRVGITVLPPEIWNPFDLNIIRWRLAGPDRLATCNRSANCGRPSSPWRPGWPPITPPPSSAAR